MYLLHESNYKNTQSLHSKPTLGEGTSECTAVQGSNSSQPRINAKTHAFGRCMNWVKPQNFTGNTWMFLLKYISCGWLLCSLTRVQYSRFIQSSAVHRFCSRRSKIQIYPVFCCTKDVVRWRSKFHPLPSLPSLPGIWDSSTHKKPLWQIIWMLLDIPQSLYLLLLRKAHKSHSQAGLARCYAVLWKSNVRPIAPVAWLQGPKYT